MDHKPQVAYAERLEHDGLQSPWRRDAMDPIRKCPLSASCSFGCGLFVNDRKFPARTIFFSHTNQPASSTSSRTSNETNQPIEQAAVVAWPSFIVGRSREFLFSLETDVVLSFSSPM